VISSLSLIIILFALSMMFIFNVVANLMSLGAIDFGIIIDGAVIIVEYIAFKITGEWAAIRSLDKEDRRKAMDQISYSGATKMMRSAVFGQVIIIIVFIPILTLSGEIGRAHV